MRYNEENRLDRVIQNANITIYYQYDSAGQRVRKTLKNSQGTIVETRKYVGGWEVYERKAAGVVDYRRESLQVMDDKERVALVETKLSSGGVVQDQLVRHQYTNHLGTATLELDTTGAIISYEEYYPFGSTSFQSGRTAAEVSRKRYRFTGKERDEESGFYYHGARYYIPWLCRWGASDPLQHKMPFWSSYNYGYDNPVRWKDSTGKQPDHKEQQPQEKEVASEESKEEKKSGGWYLDKKGKIRFLNQVQTAEDFEKLGIEGKYLGDYDDSNFSGKKYNDDGTITFRKKGKNIEPVDVQKTALKPAIPTSDTIPITNETVAASPTAADSNKPAHWYETVSKFNAVFGATATVIEKTPGSFRLSTAAQGISPKYYNNAWTGNQYAKTFNIGRIGQALGSLSLALGVGADLKGVFIYSQNPNSPNAVHPAKATFNTAMGAYAYWVNPVAGALYFGLDAFYPGGWEKALDDNAKMQNEVDKIMNTDPAKPHFYILPWGAQKL